MSRFDWPALIRCGLGGLRLAPDVFWALTPAELQMMIGPAQSAGPLSRERLEHLMQTFPDHAVPGQTPAAQPPSGQPFPNGSQGDSK